MSRVSSVEESTAIQKELFAKGYWWLDGNQEIYLPPHKDYYIIYGQIPGRMYYSLKPLTSH